MSRGLGSRQVLILRALAELERTDGTGQFYVWAVLKMAWQLGLQQEEADQRAARKAADARWLEGVQARVAEGDAQAEEQLRLHRMIRSFDGVLRRNANPGRWRRPHGAYLVEGINPSRCFGLMAKRGLVERNARPGPLASIGLTVAGRAEAAKIINQLAVANPAPEAA